MTDVEARIADITTGIQNHDNADALRLWWGKQTRTMDESWLPQDRFEKLKAMAVARMNELKGASAANSDQPTNILQAG